MTVVVVTVGFYYFVVVADFVDFDFVDFVVVVVVVPLGVVGERIEIDPGIETIVGSPFVGVVVHSDSNRTTGSDGSTTRLQTIRTTMSNNRRSVGRPF